ncbi:agamous-like MADS-box protein MADS3 [Fagus crenata]
MHGEDLGSLNLKELQHLEKQLDRTLSQARQRKTEVMLARLEELRKKELDLGEINKQLKSKLEEHGQRAEANQEPGNPSRVARDNLLKVPTPHANHTESEPNLQMGYRQPVPQEEAMAIRNLAGGSNRNQGWLL